MQAALTTLAVALFLLPGILFFSGLYSRERFSRDIARAGLLRQMATALIVSWIVHGFAVVAFSVIALIVGHGSDARICGLCLESRAAGDGGLATWLACWACDAVAYAGAFAERMATAGDNTSVMRAIWDYPLLSWPYPVLAGGFGWLAGRWVARLIIQGHLRSLVDHDWIYGLVKESQLSLVDTYALTRVHRDGNYLLYAGILKEFYTGNDGKIAYIVLSNLRRRSFNNLTGEWMAQFRDFAAAEPRTASGEDSFVPSQGRLILEGPDIENVFFQPRQSRQSLDEAERKIDAALDAQRRSRATEAATGAEETIQK